MPIYLGEGLSFDDILLEPKYSEIGSRFNNQINFCQSFLPALKYPIMSANMDTITKSEMVNKMWELGCLGIIHRFMSIEDQINELNKIEIGYKIPCIGTGKEQQERLDQIISNISGIDYVLIDIAHGHSQNMINQIEYISQQYPHLKIIAGNIATYQGAIDLIRAGAFILKVGVGPGSLCSTRVNTGCGVPQLTAIEEVKQAVKDIGKPIGIIADGGIKTAGDIIKALVFGADLIMIGNLLSGTNETPGKIYQDSNGMYKIFRGMASKSAQEDWKGFASSIEGEIKKVYLRGPVENIINELIANILSGMSYLNAKSLPELQKNVSYRKISQAGLRESVPHGLL